MRSITSATSADAKNNFGELIDLAMAALAKTSSRNQFANPDGAFSFLSPSRVVNGGVIPGQRGGVKAGQ